MDLHIRAERPEDAAGVDDILVQAFGRTYEADLVIRLREAGRASITLVAEKAGAPVGHILFSPLALTGYAPPHAPEALPERSLVRPPTPWPGCAPGSICLLALAPVAVLPAFQRQGIGGKLIKQGLLAAGPLTWASGVVVVGHAAYYPRFGFLPASNFDLTCPFKVPDESFLALELEPGALAGKHGQVAYAPEFKA